MHQGCSRRTSSPSGRPYRRTAPDGRPSVPVDSSPMAFRDRFWTPTTAKAILSWRLLLGAAASVVAGLLGVPIAGAVALGVAAYAGAVALAIPRPERAPVVDPFTVSEPWRQMVQAAQR